MLKKIVKSYKTNSIFNYDFTAELNMDVLTFIFSEENVRTVIILIAVIGGVVWLKYDMKLLKYDMKLLKYDIDKSIDEKMDEKLDRFHESIKANDFAHLNRTIKALTFTLGKNKIIDKERRNLWKY